MFEPRKKIIYDSEGNKIYCASNNWVVDRHLISPENADYLNKTDGWNVADKDYVDFKINELKHNLELINYSQNNLPSAPDIKTDTLKSTLSSKNTLKSRLYSKGINTKEGIEFFSSGIILKKSWTILEINLFCSDIKDEEISLMLCNFVDNTTIPLSKLKISNKKMFVADTKYKIDSTKPYKFVIQLNNDIADIKTSLQILVLE